MLLSHAHAHTNTNMHTHGNTCLLLSESLDRLHIIRNLEPIYHIFIAYVKAAVAWLSNTSWKGLFIIRHYAEQWQIIHWFLKFWDERFRCRQLGFKKLDQWGLIDLILYLKWPKTSDWVHELTSKVFYRSQLRNLFSQRLPMARKPS